MIDTFEVDGLTAPLLSGQLYEWKCFEPMIKVRSLEDVTRSLHRQKFVGRQWFLQSRNAAGHITGQLVARISPTLTCENGVPLGILGFFDALNEPETVTQLLDTASRKLAEEGVAKVVGPMDGDTWHTYRTNVGPWTESPFLLEPTNPKYYESLWMDAGFNTVDNYHSLRVDDISTAIKSTQPALDRAVSLGYRFRDIDLNQFESELSTIYRLSCACFHDNFLFEEISESEFIELYGSASAIADPQLIKFAESSQGEVAGFLFCLIDYARAVAAMGGGQGWLAKLRFLMNRRHATAVNFKSIGVSPAHRRRSLAGALMHLGYKATHELGFQNANLCLIRDGNASSRLDGGCGEILRRYRLYEKSVNHTLGV